MVSRRARAETITSRDRVQAPRECKDDNTRPAATEDRTLPWPAPWLTTGPLPVPFHPFAAAWPQGYVDWAGFCQLRLRRDAETLANLALCRTPQQAGAVWVRALFDAASDYAGAVSGTRANAQDGSA